MAATHICYKSKTWNTREMQTYIMNGGWPFILYAENIFPMFPFIFICSLLKAPLHGNSAFIIYKKWPYKSQKRDSSFILYLHSSPHYWECNGTLFIYTTSPNELLSSNGRAAVKQVCRATIEQPSGTVEQLLSNFFFSSSTHWAFFKRKKKFARPLLNGCSTVLDSCSTVLDSCSTVAQQLLGRLVRWLLDCSSTSACWD